MTLIQPERNRNSLDVLPMAIALVVAAILGAASGLIWQSSGLGEETPAEQGDEAGAEGAAGETEG